MALEAYKSCRICPRNCGVDRTVGPAGFCRSGSIPHVAHYGAHHWEEPQISGRLGSGTVFFSGCNLRCAFCQNKEISRCEIGEPKDAERLSDIFLELGESCHNINLVTPSHFLPSLIEALQKAKERGLNVPVVYNTGSYEKASAIRQLEGLVDIYLPDLKYRSSRLSKGLSNAPDYFENATAAILEMHRQVGHLETDASGTAQKGLLIRHLVLPGETDDSIEVLNWIRDNIGKFAFLSIMSQYTPEFLDDRSSAYNRKLTREEYAKVVDRAMEIGFINAMTQDMDSSSPEYVPDFNQI